MNLNKLFKNGKISRFPNLLQTSVFITTSTRGKQCRRYLPNMIRSDTINKTFSPINRFAIRYNNLLEKAADPRSILNGHFVFQSLMASPCSSQIHHSRHSFRESCKHSYKSHILSTLTICDII